MDVERVQRLGSLVAIGVASQLSAEFMRSRSSTHSFWILIGVSLIMMVIQVVFKQLLEFKSKINVNWHPWVTILAQTMMGLETIVWTLYGSATGQWVLAMYNDMSEVPTFFYFLPLWAFLFSYYAVTKSRLEDDGEGNQATTVNEILSAFGKRLEKLEAGKGIQGGVTKREKNFVMDLAF